MYIYQTTLLLNFFQTRLRQTIEPNVYFSIYILKVKTSNPNKLKIKLNSYNKLKQISFYFFIILLAQKKTEKKKQIGKLEMSHKNLIKI